MVKTLLSTHADKYTRTNTHVRTRTNTPQQIYCWQLSRTQTHIAAADGLHHRYASSGGDVIHPQLRCGSGYETMSRAFRARGRFRWFEAGRHCFQTIILLRIEHCSLY